MLRSSRELQKLALAYRTTTSLIEDPLNARAHGKLQVAAIAKSIQTFGFNVPILIDGESRVLAGHGRLLAAKSLGLAEVPTVSIDHLTEAQRRAYMIADNRLTDLSRWDEKILGETLRDLSLVELDFDLDAVGFSVAEIDLKIDGLDDPPDADEPLIMLEAEPVTGAGELWQLGRHRLLCADALDPVSWDRLMRGEKAAIGFSDPPYNLPIHGFVSGLGRTQHREFSVGVGETESRPVRTFSRGCLPSDGAAFGRRLLPLIAMDWRHASEMLAAGEAAFTELKNLCVWVKPAGGMGSLYRSRHELFFVWKSGRARHRNNVELGKYGRGRSNVWEYASAAVFRYSEGADLFATHPTCKPVPLVADALLDASKRGDVVIDPFLGSGTTLVAAERVGRTCYGMELDPLYCDAIIRRFEALTGEQAQREDGVMFAHIAKPTLEGEAA